MELGKLELIKLLGAMTEDAYHELKMKKSINASKDDIMILEGRLSALIEVSRIVMSVKVFAEKMKDYLGEEY